MRDLWSDLRYAVRSLARRPGFTAVAVATLALGIGANAAIFSAVHAFLLAPLPFADPERLVLVHDLSRDGDMMPVAVPNFLDVEERASSFAGLAAYRSSSFNLAGGGERPERVDGVMATPDLFGLLGVELRLGQGLPMEGALTADGGGGGPAVAVLGDGLWRRRFAADPAVVGSTLDLDGRRFTVVGVVASDFELPWSDEVDVWVPMALWADELLERGNHSNTLMIGRLAPGATLAVARQEVETIYAELATAYPGTNRYIGGRVVDLGEHVVAEVRPALLLLWGAVGFVLLIACANLANLMLVRGAGRQREIAVRRALGAGRGRLLRQLLTESVVLGFGGAALGLLLGAWGIELLRSTAESADRLSLDLAVFLFAGALGVATGVAVGLLPALAATRSTAAGLAEGGRGGAGDRSGTLLRRALVGAEIAMALVLLIGAGLMIESFRQLATLDLGFVTEERMIADLLLPAGGYGDEARRLDFYDRLLARLEARPEVAAAAFASPLPLSFSSSGHSVDVEGQPREEGDNISFRYSRVSPDYFATLQIPLLAGRLLAESDGPGAPPAMLVDELVARQLWPGDSALGKRLRPNNSDDWVTIVGVVGSVHHIDLDQPRQPQLYYPLRQGAPTGGHLVIETRGDGEAAAAVLREEVAALDPELPLGEVRSFADQRHSNVESYWYPMLLLGSFAALALALAALGIYGVMSYAVSQRRREIGVRMALGAARREVVGMVLGEGARLALVGAALGLVGGVALSRLMAGVLYGVEPGDPVTVAVVTAVLAGVALLASWVPARRAARVDPMEALRWE